jgi:hypothetical protein
MLAVGNQDDQLEPMTALDSALTLLEIPHTFQVARGVGHDFGKLYNVVGMDALQLHASCFARHQPPPEEPPPTPTPPPGPDDTLTEKIYMPFLNRHLRNRIAFE